MRRARAVLWAIGAALGCQGLAVVLGVRDAATAYCNPKGALGFGLPGPLGHTVAFALLGILGALLFAETRQAARAGLILMLAGGLSNEFERLWHGCVTDYLSFLGISMFNPADALLLLGALLYGATLFQKKAA